MGAYSYQISTYIHACANINSTQTDTLSHWLDTYTLPKPNQTPTTHSNNNLDTVYILAQLAQRAVFLWVFVVGVCVCVCTGVFMSLCGMYNTQNLESCICTEPIREGERNAGFKPVTCSQQDQCTQPQHPFSNVPVSDFHRCCFLLFLLFLFLLLF